MAREIRITIDDDEVFERMKRRKRALDLSWEEVLYQGLGVSPQRDRSAGAEFGENLKRQIQSQVMDAMQASFGIDATPTDPTVREPTEPPEPPAPDLGEEMAALSEAEDASLAFAFLPDEAAYRVPLRVNLVTTPEGLDVEVVAVRTGKGVRDANRFDGDARRTVTRHLARGETAVLRLADGEEAYRVRPALTWGRSDDGRPAVTGVEVAEVVLDADE